MSKTRPGRYPAGGHDESWMNFLGDGEIDESPAPCPRCGEVHINPGCKYDEEDEV